MLRFFREEKQAARKSIPIETSTNDPGRKSPSLWQKRKQVQESRPVITNWRKIDTEPPGREKLKSLKERMEKERLDVLLKMETRRRDDNCGLD
jgi:hypothetical protein